MTASKYHFFALILVTLLLTNFCSIKKMAMNQVADALTGSDSSTVFYGDNDPELVGDALPFTIKMYESLMVSMPWHDGLRLQTGSLYVMYANAFLQSPSEMMTDEEMLRQEFLENRAKNLYLRGRDMLLEGIEKKHPGFLKKLEKKEYESALSPMTRKDVPILYWAAAGWLGAYALDPFDMKLGMTVPRAAAIMDRAMELYPDFREGGLHDFYVLYYGSMPDYMGGSFEKARKHYKLALETAGKKVTSPHLSLATSVSVQEQKVDEFKELLNRVLEVDPDADPENRLLNTINQRKAKWLLEHVDNFFLEEEPLEEEPEEKLPADEPQEKDLSEQEQKE